ncbi:MAG: triose-phosphate isomerase [Chlamydiae bacterium]|nr:triose-phosphate isomerase [Chlamydiota bacterium]
MVRRKIIVGNWKMFKTEKEAEQFIQTLSPLITSSKTEVYLAVPFVDIHVANLASKNSNIVIGAQNMYFEKEGAFTGEISSLMLKTAGVEFVILGHSERRTLFHEDDAMINQKVISALKEGLEPILCIGETEKERELKKTEEVLKRQLKMGLGSIAKEDVCKIIIAYEPVWAIGTGKSATSPIAEEAHHFIRKTLADLFDQKTASKISILYGGSVKPGNIADLIKEPNIDGALVGGSALDPKSFAEIINNC